MQETHTWNETVKRLFANSRDFTKEESEAHNRMIKERSVVVSKLYETTEKPVTTWTPRDWGN
jgi:hypothetical protein